MFDNNQEGIATNNDNLDVENPSTVETTVESTVKEPETSGLSLDEAVLKAFEKHSVKEDENKKVKADQPDTSKKVVGGDERSTMEDGKQIDPVTGRELQPIKPPASWTPALREKWGTIDPVVQKFVADRERQINENLSKTAEERAVAKQFRDALTPYESMFKQGGVNGLDHVKELLGFSKTLHAGSPQEKATLLYNMINQFKPDPATLAALFSGQIQPQQQQARQVDPQAEVNRILAERDQQATVGDVQSHMDSFANDPANEFFHDVRETMGKIISADLVSGDTLPELFKNAYEMAVANHPEIQQILASRQSASLPVPQAQATSSVKPVQSVKPSLGSGKTAQAMGKKTGLSIDEAIAQAARDVGF